MINALEKTKAPAGTGAIEDNGKETTSTAPSVSSAQKMSNWGATPEDWMHFDLLLGLGDDLLPVVCNPAAEISPTSTMTDKGKTPSDYNGKRQIRGVHGWPSLAVSEFDLKRWEREPDYGICVRTATVRGLDVDATDPVLAKQVREFIAQELGLALPCRYRSNSSKFLHPFRLVGEYGKRVIHCQGDNKIEFLMNGQQFVAVGTHPSGARYEWAGGLPVEIPTLAPEQFERLFSSLQQTFGTREPTVSGAAKRLKAEHLDIDDPVLPFIEGLGQYLGDMKDGGAIVVCPWEHEHTMGETGDGRTVYYPAGTNGKTSAGFKCLHGHCEGRKLPDYLAAIGYVASADDFEDVSEPEGQAATEPPHFAFYAYLPTHQYLHRPTRAFWPAASVDGSLTMKIEGKKVSQWLDKFRAVQQATWHPAHGEVLVDTIVADGGFVPKPGAKVYNRYRPPVLVPSMGDASPWLNHLQAIYPGEAAHLIKWFAHRIQRPGEKINHALVLGGAQGIGKDTVLEPVRRGVGPWNWADIDPKKLTGAFNPFVESVVLRINEARDLGDLDRFAFYDHSKTYIAAPPDVLMCNNKHQREYPVFNVMGVILTTNHKTNGIYLPLDDRRHYVAWSNATKDDFAEGYWRGLWDWLDAGGAEAVVGYLQSVDLSGFNPKAPPPKTEAFYAIVQANANPDDLTLAGLMLREDGSKLPAVTLNMVVQAAVEAEETDLAFALSDTKNRRRVPHMMEKAGYVPVRNEYAADGLWKIDGRRQVVYGDSALSTPERVTFARSLVGASQ
jgi:hypothetical protein